MVMAFGQTALAAEDEYTYTVRIYAGNPKIGVLTGNALLESDTYYGNPGERQYVSSRYVDGYVPQALNLVKTLSVNEAENVFTFIYTSTAGTVQAPPATNAGAGTVMSHTPIYIGIGAVALAALIVAAVYLNKHRKL